MRVWKRRSRELSFTYEPTESFQNAFCLISVNMWEGAAFSHWTLVLGLDLTAQAITPSILPKTSWRELWIFPVGENDLIERAGNPLKRRCMNAQRPPFRCLHGSRHDQTDDDEPKLARFLPSGVERRAYEEERTEMSQTARIAISLMQ